MSSKCYSLEAVIAALERAIKHARDATLGLHFESEINHLIATAKANKEGYDS